MRVPAQESDHKGVFKVASNTGLQQVSGSDSRYIRNDICVVIGQPTASNNVLARVIAGSHEPEIVVKQTHQPGQVPHTARDVLIDIATISHAQPPSGRRHELHIPGCAGDL